ncbi:pentatricopeptide repeat-containing protein At5g40410, mitochondrial [Magnolia sinica]|uniref:pentatricopeptide repeat-containing protein At5g40410, mitochondrial n=1 Tax=Magnolia sinica TaxID=86752 RepID=UPI00265A4D98|nr:pentatricopeptide repeat-containing protein At5g40410, mitochondrial [Magnolia sinica]
MVARAHTPFLRVYKLQSPIFSSALLLFINLKTISSFCSKACKNSGANPPLLDPKSCLSISDCRKSHAQAIKYGLFSNGSFPGDQLVIGYVNCGYFDDARQLFDEIPKDVVSWNSTISAFLRRGNASEGLRMFHQMRLGTRLKPNSVTLISVLSACADLQALDDGKFVHGYATKEGFLWEIKVVNSLINMYGKCESMDAACTLFETMPTRNLVSWNSIIAVHAQSGLAEDAISIYNSMRRADFKPDRATLMSMLQACSILAVARLGKAIHGYIVSCGFIADMPIMTTLINVYAKSGSLDTSQEVFAEMIDPDAIAWTAMLAGYSMHGRGREAMDIFKHMVGRGIRPDHVTYTHLLSACSHSGLVAEGKKYFEDMSKAYRIEARVDHYSCMVDLLGRSGLLREARQLIENMSIEPNAGVWGALLGACRMHHNIDLGKEAAERLFVLEPLDPRNYIILSSMYSAAGMWRDALKARALMKERGVRKNPGCSFIEHGNKLHRFVAGDQSHPEAEKIYMKLEELTRKMRGAGYVPRTEFVLHDVDEELKEDMINAHSEKLAIAFGLLVMGNSLPIMITKNLRICGDCHNAAKFISSIERRILIIRDSKRFHHFEDGSCSCDDFW